jgi:hypothetical protein
VTVRIVIWNLFDSKTTVDELREHLLELPAGDHWISNAVQERFGLVSYAPELPDLRRIVELIGEEPAIAEEFDVE